jgi:hypothetical protein
MLKTMMWWKRINCNHGSVNEQQLFDLKGRANATYILEEVQNIAARPEVNDKRKLIIHGSRVYVGTPAKPIVPSEVWRNRNWTWPTAPPTNSAKLAVARELLLAFLKSLCLLKASLGASFKKQPAC